MPIDVFLVSAYGAGATRLPAQILARSQRKQPNIYIIARVLMGDGPSNLEDVTLPRLGRLRLLRCLPGWPA